MTRHWSIRVYLFGLLLALVVPLLGLLGVVVYLQAEDALREAQATTLTLAQLTANHTAQLLSESKQTLVRLVERPQVRTLTPAQCDPLLNDLLSLHHQFSNFLIINMSGQVICSAVPLPGSVFKVIDDPLFQAVQQTDAFAIRGPEKGIIIDKWVVRMAYPIHDEAGQPLGVLGLDLDLTQYQALFEGNLLFANTPITILNGQGTIIARSLEPEKWIGRSGIGVEIVDIALAQKQGQTVAHGLDGTERVYSFTTIPGTDWQVYAGIPTVVAYAATWTIIGRGIFLGLVIILGVLALAVYLSRHIEQPIRYLAQTVQAVTAGNREIRASLEGPIEVAEVAAQFNMMVEAQSQAEAALRQSEVRYRSLVELSPEAIYVVVEHKIMLANDACVKLFGATDPSQIIGKSPLEFTHPDFLPITQERIHQLVELDQPAPLVEQKIVRLDGTVVDVEVRAAPYNDQGLRATQVLLRNITERKQMEEALRQNEQRFRQLVENSPDVIYRLDRNLRHLYISPRVQDFTGIPAEQFIGKTGLETGLSSEIWPPFVAACQQALETGQPQLYRFVVTASDGLHYFEGRLIPERTSDGAIGSLLGITTEYTTRKQAEEALYQSQERLNLALTTARMGVWEWDIQTNAIFWSAESLEIVGLENYSAGLESFTNLLHPEDADRVMAAARQALVDKSVYQSEFRIIRPDGQVRWLANLGQASYDDTGQPLRLVGIVQDITERKQAQVQVNYLADLLDKVSDAIISTGPPPDFKIVSWNRAAERIYGWTAAEIIGQPIVEVVRPHRTETEQIAIRHNLIQTGQWRGEQIHQYRDGRLVYIEANTQVVYDSVGQVASYVTVNRDITERQQAEENLRRYERIVSATPDGIALVDRNYVYQIVNETYLAWHNKRREEIVGHTVSDLLGPEVFETVVREQFDRCLAGETVHYQAWFDYPNQGQQFRGITYFPYFEADGTISGVVGLTRNLTELKQTEQALFQQTERLKVLNKISRDILAGRSLAEIAETILNRLCQLLSCERGTVTLFDDEAGEVVILAAQTDTISVLPAGLRLPYSAVAGWIALARRGEINVVDDTLALVQPSEFVTALMAEGIRSYIRVPLLAREKLIGSLNLGAYAPAAFTAEQVDIVREVADQLAIALRQARLFEQVQVSQKRLEALSRQLLEAQETERRRLAYELHDEIGQTLTAIKLNLQVLQRLPQASPQPIIESIGMMDQAIQQVRDLSLNLRPSLLDDLGLVATLRWFLDRQAQRSGLNIHLRVEPPDIQPPPYLNTVCFRVVQEALTNVIRHARAQRVWVELLAQERELRLNIQDDGRGFVVEESFKWAAQGVSLGLIGMQERISLAGGKLEIDSAPGRGTEIRVSFPLDR